jgi:hypothetical protein
LSALNENIMKTRAQKITLMKNFTRSLGGYVLVITALLFISNGLISCGSSSEDPAPQNNIGGDFNNDGDVDGSDLITDEPAKIIGCQYPTDSAENAFKVDSSWFQVLGANNPLIFFAMGHSFSVAVKGKINSVAIKVADTSHTDSYRVRIYKLHAADDDYLAEAVVDATDLMVWQSAAIAPLDVDPGEVYIICIYIKSKLDQQKVWYCKIPNFTYPMTIGDVTLEGVVGETNSIFVNPQPASAGFFQGMVDFCFEAD